MKKGREGKSWRACALLLLVASGVAVAHTRGIASEVRVASSLTRPALEARLETIVTAMLALSSQDRLRRSLAQASFCLPQNVLGILLYGALELAGEVLHTAEMNETTIVVIRPLLGVSLGRYIFLPAAFLSEENVRHEYGHTLQGYRYGPFYLPLVGTASFAQAAISALSPDYAAQYFERWPENEAEALGGVKSPRPDGSSSP